MPTFRQLRYLSAPAEEAMAWRPGSPRHKQLKAIAARLREGVDE